MDTGGWADPIVKAYAQMDTASRKIGWPEHYKKDVWHHDVRTLQRERPSKFVWILRECGSYLFPIGKWRRHQIDERLMKSQAIEFYNSLYKDDKETKRFFTYHRGKLTECNNPWLVLDWMERENRRARKAIARIIETTKELTYVEKLARLAGQVVSMRLDALLDIYRFYGDFPEDWHWQVEKAPYSDCHEMSFALRGFQYIDETRRTVERQYVFCQWNESEQDWRRHT